MKYSMLSDALKAMYTCPTSDLIPKEESLLFASYSFAQAKARAYQGLVRRAGWRKFHNCGGMWLHWSLVGELDKQEKDWLYKDDPSVFTQPLMF